MGRYTFTIYTFCNLIYDLDCQIEEWETYDTLEDIRDAVDEEITIAKENDPDTTHRYVQTIYKGLTKLDDLDETTNVYILPTEDDVTNGDEFTLLASKTNRMWIVVHRC
jgi:hypothetical protein